MNRRQAIANIVLGTAAITFLPGCQSITVPVFENFEVEPKSYQLLSHLASIILPKGEIPIETREPTAEYILNVVDACYAPEDRQEFLEGWTAYQTYVEEVIQKRPKKWEEEQVATVLEKMELMLEEDNKFASFYKSTKNLTIQHFTTSEHYMQKYLEYQFIPGGYQGCLALEGEGASFLEKQG
ncbi:MAG: gluconate 2-dehydrogenase subunit 3 family protein [Bacteroidota bacterium]